MHTPFARLIVALLVLPLLAHQALAQDAGKVPGLDESKIPDWIKRQAASPQKTILNSTGAKPKAEAPKAEVVPVRVNRQAPRRQPLPPAVEPASARPATAATELPLIETPPLASSSPVVEDAAPSVAPAVEAPAIAPAGTLAASAPPELTQPVPTPAVDAAAAAKPAAELALQLLDKTDPTLTADLIDARLADASVTVAFTVGTKGEVIAPQIVASTDRRLNRPVLRAVAEWRYAPVNEPRPHSVKFSFAVTP